MQGTSKEKQHPVEVSVDGETYTAPSKEMTPDQILQLAGIDPTQNYLVEKHGREQTSYQNNGETSIKVHENETFISVPTGDTTVS
jgi:hypothetical protein